MKANDGQTLIEFLIVASIIGIIAAVGVPALTKAAKAQVYRKFVLEDETTKECKNIQQQDAGYSDLYDCKDAKVIYHVKVIKEL